MIKKIFTPFKREIAATGQLISTLSNNLRCADIQQGFSPEKRKRGQYRGFNREDYIFAPPPGGLLKDLLMPEDQLYINAHCLAGKEYVAASEDLAKEPLWVDNLIKQLVEHGFPKESKAKIKLWICQGGLDGPKGESCFAKAFSMAMFKKGFQACRIFAYTQKVFGEYVSDDKGGWFKWALVQEPVQRKEKSEKELNTELEAYIKNNLQKLRTTGQTKIVWNLLIKKYKTDESAIEQIFQSVGHKRIFNEAFEKDNPSPLYQRVLGLRTEQLRAKLYRLEFHDGKVLNHEIV